MIDNITIWKPVSSYENLYAVSNDGRVRRIAGWGNKNNGYRKATGELKLSCVKGYMQVSLYKDAVETRYKVHRLVASVFIPNPNNYPQVNHIDGNKANNTVSNLEWVTCSQNVKHAHAIGIAPNDTPKMRQARHNVGLKTQNILNFNPCKKVIFENEAGTVTFKSCQECARLLHLNATYVSKYCKNGKYAKRVGGKFRYADQSNKISNG